MNQGNSILTRARKTLIGNRTFYAMVLAVVVPIIVQNAITNFVSLLDNIMVGKVGTDQMTGVSIANQLLFVFNLCIFGGMSGAGIFAAQFFGAGDHDGVRHCFRYKLYLAVILTAIAIVVFLCFGNPLISLYLNEENESAERIALTLNYSLNYLHIMLWGIVPFAFAQAYASTLREMGETTLPMAASISAVLINLVGNYILIYGHFGAPAMGVEGAAIATVISRYAELIIIAVATHLHPQRFAFIQGAFRSPHIPIALVKQITVKGMPLLVNEALWSLGIASIAQCYSMRGLDVVAALNISNTVANLFNVVFYSNGNATAIIIGQALGGRETAKARDYAWKLAAFGVAASAMFGILLAVCAPFIPMIYNVETEIRHLATALLLVCACYMPIGSFANTSYFILRSGGKTIITFFFDCGFSWIVSLPLAYVLVRFTALPIVAVYACVQMADLIKCIVGYILVRSNFWMNNMVAQ